MANNFRHVFLRKPEHTAEERPAGEHFIYGDSYGYFTIEEIVGALSHASDDSKEPPARRNLAPGDAILDGDVVYLVRPEEVLEMGTLALALQLKASLPHDRPTPIPA